MTICTHKWICLFRDVTKGGMRLTKYGVIVEEEWLKTSQLRTNLVLDEYIVMPNHFHGIILVHDDGRGTARRAPTVEQFGRPVSQSLPTVVRSFKSAVTRQINIVRNTPGKPLWQRNYYEHIRMNAYALSETRMN